MRRGIKVKLNGFTLVELMVVVAIIAILASIAIPQYLKYQRKAKVSSYALPLARACIMDMVTWCVDNPNTNNNQPSKITTPNCPGDNTTHQSTGGQVTLTATSFSCDNQGQISSNGTLVTGTLADITDYEATCEFANNSVRCRVRGK